MAPMNMMHDPHLHIEPTECDAAPRPGSWLILMLLVAAIVVWGPTWFIIRVIDAVLYIVRPV
jgi:hypothetical protein